MENERYGAIDIYVDDDGRLVSITFPEGYTYIMQGDEDIYVNDKLVKNIRLDLSEQNDSESASDNNKDENAPLKTIEQLYTKEEIMRYGNKIIKQLDGILSMTHNISSEYYKNTRAIRDELRLMITKQVSG